MSKVKVGDKVKVVRVAESFEDDGYEVGDVYEVVDVCGENRIYEPEEGAILLTSTGIELYEKEVELYKEDEDEVYNGIVSGLSQAIENAFHRMSTEDREWEAMPEVGKEVIYDDYNPDSVEHPSHYTQGKFETIEIIAQTVSGYDDGFTAHCVGTATKYLNRAPFKHETPLEDLKKAAKYLEFAIEHEEKKRKWK